MEKLCLEICLIDKGRTVLEGSLGEIKKSYGHDTVTLRFKGDGSFLKDLPQVESVNDHGNEFYLRLVDGADPKAILDAAHSRLDVEKFEVAEPSIHDIFIDQVSSE